MKIKELEEKYKTSNPDSIIDTGCGIFPTSDEISMKDNVNTYLRSKLNKETFNNLLETCSRFVLKPGQVELLTILTDKKFDLLSTLASVSKTTNIRLFGCKEEPIIADILYTNDDLVSNLSIPKYFNGNQIKRPIYKKDKTYLVRIASKEIYEDGDRVLNELIAYIPLKEWL